VKGKKWAKEHHFDTPGKLPARVGRKKGKKAVKRKGKKAGTAKRGKKTKKGRKPVRRRGMY
jgi:hypothetical protein